MEIIGVMAWKHPGGSAMVIEFRHDPTDKRTPYHMGREFMGPDGVGRRGGTEWRTVEGAREEWRAMCARYAAKGWERVPLPDGGIEEIWKVGECSGCGCKVTGRRAERGTCLDCGGPFTW